MTPTIETPVPTSEECIRASLELLREAQALERGPSNLGSSARAQSAVLVAKAQVWATLATAPQPLEPVQYATLESGPPTWLNAKLPEMPVLICPHGYAAKLELQEGEGEGQLGGLKYTWVDCETCP
jgi:hypothetical protein